MIGLDYQIFNYLKLLKSQETYCVAAAECWLEATREANLKALQAHTIRWLVWIWILTLLFYICQFVSFEY